MKKYIKWGVIGLSIIVVVVGIMVFSNKIYPKVTKVKEKPTVEQQAIIDKDIDKIKLLN